MGGLGFVNLCVQVNLLKKKKKEIMHKYKKSNSTFLHAYYYIVSLCLSLLLSHSFSLFLTPSLSYSCSLLLTLALSLVLSLPPSLSLIVVGEWYVSIGKEGQFLDAVWLYNSWECPSAVFGNVSLGKVSDFIYFMWSVCSMDAIFLWGSPGVLLWL